MGCRLARLDYGQLVTRTTWTQDDSHPRQLIPKTTRTQDNSYPRPLVPKMLQEQKFHTEFLDPYRFNLHTTLGHHGHSINCGHYTASINCCEKIIPTIQEFLNAISMIPISHLLLYNVECLWRDHRGWELMHFWIRLCSYYVVVVVVVWGSIQRRWHSCLQQPSHVCTISPNSKLPLQTHIPDPGNAPDWGRFAGYVHDLDGHDDCDTQKVLIIFPN